MMADTMETLEIEVKHKASGAVDEIDKLAWTLLKLNRYLSGTTIPKLKELASVLEDVGKAQTKVTAAVSGKSGSSKEKTFAPLSEGAKEAIRNLQKYEVSWLKLADKQDKMEAALSKGDAAGAVYGRDKVLKAQEEYSKEYWKVFGSDDEEEKVSVWDRIKTAIKGATVEIQKLAQSSEKATKHTNKLVSSFGRVMFYRSIRKVISEISKAFSEGLQNAYAYSSMIGSSISQTMDSFASLGMLMKNQLGSAFGELLTTIRPIIELIINLITKAADALSQFFAILGGRSVYHKATGATQKWAAATQSGADAAKEWKNQLMGFDEINRLEDQAGTGGGGGGGASGVGDWELSPVTLDFSWLDKYKEVTKEWVENLDFEPMLKAWDTLKKRISEFASIVDSALFWAYKNVLLPIGKWVIEKAAPASVELLASAFNFLNAVLEAISPALLVLWETVLKPIASWIGTAFIDAINWLKDAFDGLAEKIRNADSFGDFLRSLNGKETIILGVATAIGAIVTAMAAFNTVNSIIKTFAGLVGLMSNPIGIAIVAITGLVIAGVALYQNWDNITAGLKDLWEKIGTIAKTVFTAISTFVTGTFDKILVSSNDFSGRFINKIIGLKTNVINMFESIRSTIANILEKVKGLFDFSWSLPRPKIPHIGWTWDWMEAVGISIPIPNFKLEWYASGGFPDEDGLFMANHNELVGQFSNGKTAVANNEQIIAGIKQGVMDAMMTVMSYQNDGRSSKNTEFVFELNGMEFARAIYNDTKAVAKEHGGSLINA